MRSYIIQLATPIQGGTTDVQMHGDDEHHAIARAEDLFGLRAVAWKRDTMQGTVTVLGDPERIIG